MASARPYLRQWQAAWKKAERIELHSLSLKSDGKLPRLRDHFTLVGTATILDPMEKEQLATLLPALIYEGLNPHQPRSGCFQPHHGLSIFIDKQRYDFIICFECDSLWVFPEMMPFGQQLVDSLTDEQGKMLDTILKNHQIQLSRKYEADLEERQYQETLERRRKAELED